MLCFRHMLSLLMFLMVGWSARWSSQGSEAMLSWYWQIVRAISGGRPPFKC